MAVAVAAISCNTNEEAIAPSIDQKNQITINVLSDDAATRTVTTDDGSEWTVKWKQDDAINGWTMSEDGTAKDASFSKFTMKDLNDAVSASFTGTAAYEKIRLIYYTNMTSWNASEQALQINYAAQTINMKDEVEHLKIFENAVMATKELEDVSALTVDGVTPTMQNLVAGMKLRLYFQNLPADYSYAISKVVVGNSGNAGYSKLSNLVKIDPELAIDDENFYKQKGRNAITLTVNNSPAIESNNEYSLYFKSFEFDVPTGNKIQIQVTLTATNAEGSADVVKTFDIDNTSGKDLVFESGKHHELKKLCDYTGVEITTTPDAGGDTGDDKSNKITSVEDLIALATAVNDGVSQSGVTYTLENDIDLKNSEWTPIGTQANPFKGVFDGQGHTISGLYINNTDATYQALFGGLGSQGTVKGLLKNLNVEGSVTGGLNSAGVVSFVSQATVLNCSFKGSVIGSGNNGVGGIVAQLQNNSEIHNCYNLATLNNSNKSNQVGGIAGLCQNTCSIHNCYSVGTISSNKNTTGAIVGQRAAATTGTTSNIYSLTGCVTLSVTAAATAVNGEDFDEAYLQSEDFVTKLNEYVSTNTSIYKDQLKEWAVTADGYPTFK